MSKRDKTASPAQPAAKQGLGQAELSEAATEVPDIASADAVPSASPGPAPQLPEQERADLVKRAAEAEEAFALASEEIALKDARIAELEATLRKAADHIESLERKQAASSGKPAPALPSANRPGLAALKTAHLAGKRVEVTYHGTDAVALVAGLSVDRTPRIHPLAAVFECGPDHVKALAEDPTISVRIVD